MRRSTLILDILAAMPYIKGNKVMWNIIKDNNQDLSFAMDCLSIGAISVSEFKSWLKIVICDNPIDDIPGYIFDILDSNNIKLDIYKILGFSLSTVLSKQERKAVYGIAYTRRPDYGAGRDLCKIPQIPLNSRPRHLGDFP